MLILLDRDGVVNEDRADHVKNPDEFVMIPRSAEAVARLNRAGHKIALVTNQSGIGRGLYDEVMLARIHEKMRDSLARAHGHLDALFICPDRPDAATARRKPGAGMLEEAMRQFRVGPGDCVMIGDASRDLEAAAKIGVDRFLVRTGKGAKTQAAGLHQDVLPVTVCEDLWHAVEQLLGPASGSDDGDEDRENGT